MKLSNYFQITETQEKTHFWSLTTHNPDACPVESLARLLAERIVELRCRGCPHHFRAWREKAACGTALPPKSQVALRAFLCPVFGDPREPESIPRDHREGFIGELLWYFLCLEKPTEEIVRAEPPSFKATDPGGDGLVIHKIQNRYLMFRLWEMKKFLPVSSDSNSSVSSTVNTAYNQLSAKATEYLARYTVIGQELPDKELADFYGLLVDLWIERSHQAAAGVSVITSANHVPTRCFTTFGKQFSDFIDPVRLRGMLTAIDGFSEFAQQVQAEIWKGL